MLHSEAKVVPRNEGGPLRTWPLLIVILRISSTHFLQRVRVKIETLRKPYENSFRIVLCCIDSS